MPADPDDLTRLAEALRTAYLSAVILGPSGEPMPVMGGPEWWKRYAERMAAQGVKAPPVPARTTRKRKT